MDVDGGLREGAARQQLEYLLQVRLSGRRQVRLEMPCQVPVGKQIHLAQQKRFVVRRQLAGPGGELPLDERVGGVGKKQRGILGAQFVQVGARAQVGEEQKALLEVLGQYLGSIHSGVPKQMRHVHEGTAVFLVRRGVHHHERTAIVERGAEVAPETGVLRCGGEGEVGGELRGQPALHRGESIVAVYH